MFPKSSALQKLINNIKTVGTRIKATTKMYSNNADIFFNDKQAVDNIDYRDETEYEYLNPGKYTVFVKENLTGNQLATVNLEYKANRIYTIYIIGNQPNVELIQAVDGNTYACPR